MLARRYFISGRVQGVGFRYFVFYEAQNIGQIQGYVRNLYDGRVEVFAQAGPGELERLEASLRRGPRSSHIAHVEVSEEIPDDRMVDFRITH